ncbi:hypothetical protein OnM2_063063 [Erysiphe neolycopersici]|uniref:Uncharacterized protein n=1 Tax=Erysiphe neolycopersici TaxID=212602 RepID=A0A420HNR0_9PEZI|nr:hypothetical protein OnM2_063063 [Erysiphe neolycopersici]
MYDGPKFEYKGDYLIYPINPGPHRVAINWICEVVGAFTTPLTKNSDDFNSVNLNSKNLIKCHRMADGHKPVNFGEKAGRNIILSVSKSECAISRVLSGIILCLSIISD